MPSLNDEAENQMVLSEIRSLYRDADDLFRTVIKRIYEAWDATLERWTVKKVEYIFDDPPVPSDDIEVSLEHRHGWLVPPEWEFDTEVWEYKRKPVREVTYDHDSEVGILR